MIKLKALFPLRFLDPLVLFLLDLTGPFLSQLRALLSSLGSAKAA